MNILLVEDQTVTRELMVSGDAAFRGATVRAAPDLALALSGARSMAGSDMVLLDLRAADNQGLSGLIHFRGDFPQAKIVMVSSQDAPELIADALDAKASGFMFEELKNSGDDCCAEISRARWRITRLPDVQMRRKPDQLL